MYVAIKIYNKYNYIMSLTQTNLTNNQNNLILKKKIFEDKELEDLVKYLKKTENLNWWNSHLIYLFYFLQSSGIIISTYATSTTNPNIFWIGIGMNMTASLINVYEKINDGIIKKLANQISQIKNGTYNTAQPLIDIENDLTQNMLYSNNNNTQSNTFLSNNILTKNTLNDKNTLSPFLKNEDTINNNL